MSYSDYSNYQQQYVPQSSFRPQEGERSRSSLSGSQALVTSIALATLFAGVVGAAAELSFIGVILTFSGVAALALGILNCDGSWSRSSYNPESYYQGGFSAWSLMSSLNPLNWLLSSRRSRSYRPHSLPSYQNSTQYSRNPYLNCYQGKDGDVYAPAQVRLQTPQSTLLPYNPHANSNSSVLPQPQYSGFYPSVPQYRPQE